MLAAPADPRRNSTNQQLNKSTNSPGSPPASCRAPPGDAEVELGAQAAYGESPGELHGGAPRPGGGVGDVAVDQHLLAADAAQRGAHPDRRPPSDEQGTGGRNIE